MILSLKDSKTGQQLMVNGWAAHEHGDKKLTVIEYIDGNFTFDELSFDSFTTLVANNPYSILDLRHYK